MTTGWTGSVVSGTPVQNVMFRVADANSFLELFRSTVPYHIRIKVKDGIVEENNRIYDWTVDAKKSKAEPLDEAQDDFCESWYDVEATPEELVKWLFGGDMVEKYPQMCCYDRIHLPECV